MSGHSGEPAIEIAGPEAGALAALLPVLGKALSVLEDAGRRPVVIGGIAVAARVARAERATADADTLTHAEAGAPSVEILADALSGTVENRHRVVISGVKVDCIDTVGVSDADLDDIEPDPLFVGAHRFALEGADEVVLRAGGVTLACRVARPAGLLATKSHAAGDRRDEAKIASDVFDLERLIGAGAAPAMAEELSAWPNLARLVCDALTTTLIRDATKNAGRLRRAGGAMATVSEDALIVAGETMCGLLDEVLKGRG